MNYQVRIEALEKELAALKGEISAAPLEPKFLDDVAAEVLEIYKAIFIDPAAAPPPAVDPDPSFFEDVANAVKEMMRKNIKECSFSVKPTQLYNAFDWEKSEQGCFFWGTILKSMDAAENETNESAF